MREIETLLKDIFSFLRKEEIETHQKRSYRLKGWFRTKVKIRPKVYSGRKRPTLITKAGLAISKKTVAQVPGINVLWTIGSGVFSVGWKIDDAVKNKALNDLKKNTSIYGRRRPAETLKLKGKLEEYTMELGIKNMQRCLSKVNYAKQKLQQHKHVTNCENFFDFMARITWLDYRLTRLREETAIVAAYVETFQQEVIKEKGNINTMFGSLAVFVETTLLESDHEKCDAMCIREALKARYPDSRRVA